MRTATRWPEFRLGGVAFVAFVAVGMGIALVATACVAASEPSPAVAPSSVAESRMSASQPGVRANVVLFLTDDQRWDTLWAMPNVRRLLSAHGVTFDNAFVTTPLCCPARASLLTGQYSRSTGVHDGTAIPPHGGARAFDDSSTIATWLDGAGYTTGLVGKYLNGYSLLRPGYVPPGWDQWFAIAQSPQSRYMGFTLNENGRLVEYSASPGDYSTDVLAGKADAFVDRAREPFFLHLSPIAPHTPSVPAPQDAGAFASRPLPSSPSVNEMDVVDKPWGGLVPLASSTTVEEWVTGRRAMLESLLAVDRAVARVVEAVERRGALDRTMFIFTSDNGHLWGEHRLVGKTWAYDESIRVPLVIRAPDVRGPGGTDSHLVLNVDLPATIADVAGIQPGVLSQGRSLLPLLAGRSERWRSAVVLEFLGHTPSGLPPTYVALRSLRHLYVEYTNGWRELYDLQRDPHQLENLAGSAGSSALEERLRRWLRDLVAELDRVGPPGSNP